jgi:hypothetical protein
MFAHRPSSIYNFFDKTCLVSLPPLEEGGRIALAVQVQERQGCQWNYKFTIEQLSEDS